MQRLILAAVSVSLTLGGGSAATAEESVERGSGNLVTERLDMRDFTAIEVLGSWEVAVSKGAYEVQVTVDDNIVDDLRVERRGSALRFGLRRGAGIFRRLTLRAQVSMPELDAVQVSGSGHVTVAEFESHTLRVGVSGSGGVDANAPA